MALPSRVSEYLTNNNRRWVLPGDDTQACEGAKFHSPTPLFTHETRVVPREWDPEFASPMVHLCGTCRDNLNVLHQMMWASSGTLDWPIRREFGNQIRLLAERGWRLFHAPQPSPDGSRPA